MDRQLRLVFLFELQRQARFGLMATHDMQNALQSADIDRLWYSVQSFLVATGNVSKILWPTNKESERGTELRASVGVPDDSPLAPRTFRNHFEHFDERLESWATSSARRNFVDSNVGPPGMIQGVDSGDFLRNFDTESQAVTFRGDTYDLKPAVQALRDLDRDVSVALNEHLLRRGREAV